MRKHAYKGLTFLRMTLHYIHFFHQHWTKFPEIYVREEDKGKKTPGLGPPTIYLTKFIFKNLKKKK